MDNKYLFNIKQMIHLIWKKNKYIDEKIEDLVIQISKTIDYNNYLYWGNFFCYPCKIHFGIYDYDNIEVIKISRDLYKACITIIQDSIYSLSLNEKDKDKLYYKINKISIL